MGITRVAQEAETVPGCPSGGLGRAGGEQSGADEHNSQGPRLPGAGVGTAPRKPGGSLYFWL